MDQVAKEEHLAAWPVNIVVRTARGRILERCALGGWYETGRPAGDDIAFDDDDWPATVLWVYQLEEEKSASDK